MLTKEDRQETIKVANSMKQKLDVIIMQISADLEEKTVCRTVREVLADTEDIKIIWRNYLL